ncbi:ABC transporter permease [Streptomyces catenulae]|uniref:ABC transporter permease n=1 Tax=Streptomyces catenulae TaxID=66875 RepID=A0ABV2YXW2_9ACTN|nr:ABC transporter permease [Streptomyces catenulae]
MADQHGAHGPDGTPADDGTGPRDDGDVPGGGGGAAHGAHGRPPTAAQRWRAFKASPFLPACVLLFILAAAAGLFAGSYTYAMANPTPRHVPMAIVGAETAPGGGPSREKLFADGMEKALNASLRLTAYPTYAQARKAVEEQREFAVVRPRGPGVELDVAGAAGASVAELLATAGPKVGAEVGVPVRVQDIKPLQKGDPRGLALFYISLAAVIVGFVGAIQLSVHARGLNPAERIAFTIAYALLGGFVIAAVVDWWLGALHLPFVHSWLILSFTMFTTGMVFTMFNTLMGRWAMIPTWGVMVLLGNPSSGGAVSWPLLPSALGHIGQWLPPGASVNAQHNAVYFGGSQHLFPYLVLAGWSVVSCTVFWVWRHRHPGGRDTEKPPAHAAE